ncbi:molecular chaperone [Burkholderia semiarida]|uniref:Molecular chaperone n=1 Tax=Burkholderia semiarida TaxID=2843303 RepID=A0ABW7LCQ6_9BURK
MKNIKLIASLFAAICLANQASAAVVLSSTRVIYAESDPEAVVKVVNDGQVPSLLQTWLDDGNPQAGPDDSETPFAISPPMTRVEPGKSQTLRIHRIDDVLPTDRESVFWLNVLDIPPMEQGAGEARNVLRVAFRTRIKVFYRPAALGGVAADAPGQIRWKVMRRDGDLLELEALNRTPFHVNYVGLEVGAGGRWASAAETGMIAPGERRVYRFREARGVGVERLRYRFVNDFGGTSQGEAALDP